MLYQAVTGLFSNDEIAFSGPLRALVSSETSDWLSGLHRQNYWAIIVLVGLHVSAVMFYALVKKDNLLRPMVTGMKEVDEADAQPAQGGGALAFVIALAITAAACSTSPPAASSSRPASAARRLVRGDSAHRRTVGGRCAPDMPHSNFRKASARVFSRPTSSLARAK